MVPVPAIGRHGRGSELFMVLDRNQPASKGLLGVHLPRMRHHIHRGTKRSAQGKPECEMVNSRPERDAQGSTNTDSSPGRLSKSPLRCTLVAHDTLPG